MLLLLPAQIHLIPVIFLNHICFEIQQKNCFREEKLQIEFYFFPNM